MTDNQQQRLAAPPRPSLWCRIFGHRFTVIYGDRVRLTPFCGRCGCVMDSQQAGTSHDGQRSPLQNLQDTALAAFASLGVKKVSVGSKTYDTTTKQEIPHMASVTLSDNMLMALQKVAQGDSLRGDHDGRTIRSLENRGLVRQATKAGKMAITKDGKMALTTG